MLTKEQMIKLAKASPKFAAMIKKAANDTGFNEKPVSEKQNPNPQIPPTPEKEPAPVAKPVVEQPEAPAAVPQEQNGGQQVSIQDIASITARGFLGPEIFQAALNGDENAQNMVALTAANVAKLMVGMAS